MPDLPTQGAQTLTTGFIKREVFLNLTGTAVTDLTSSQKFANHQPDSVSFLRSFEAPVNAGANYGQRLSALLVPPATGAYVLFIASDDASELWLSTDGTAANKQLIASVGQWTNSREWNKYPDTQNNVGAPVQLQAGKAYYIEALMKQGGGGDNLAVGWVLPGKYVDPYNAPDGLTNITVIPGQNLGGMIDTANSHVTIITQPTNTISFTGLRAVFSIQAQGASDLGSQVLYQWKQNGQDIAGATEAYYTTPVLALTDSGTRFSCVASVPGAAVTSQEATLTVVDSLAPRLEIKSLSSPTTNAAVRWDTPDSGFYLQEAGALANPAWNLTAESVDYAGTVASVTVPTLNNRFFRLGHTNVILETLWADNITPDTTTSSQTNYELGTVFSATVPGLIRAIRVYVMPGESGLHQARIWRNSDSTVVGGPYQIGFAGVSGWFVYYLPQAVAIDANVNYTVTVSTGEDPGKSYPSSANVVSAAGGNGRSLRYPAAAGVFGTQLGARPTQTLNNSLYFRDVLFLPGEIATENLLTWALDRPVSFGRRGDGNPYEFGTVFRASVAGTINAIRVFATSAEGGDHTATIWRNSDSTIIGGPYTFACGANGGVGASDWFVYSLAQPVAIQPNTDYTVSVTTGTDTTQAYPVINGAFANAGDNGQHLSYPAGGGVSGAVGSRPTDTSLGADRNSSYLRDILFQPAGSTAIESILGGGAVYVGKQSTAYELGTVFQASTAGIIKGIRVYSTSAESGAHAARLWRNSDNTLLGGPYSLTFGGANGWSVFALSNAVPIESNVLYTVSVSTGADSAKAYPFVPEAFAGAGGNTKHLAYPVSAGVFGLALGARPTTVTNAAYLRDVVFQPVATKPRATIGNTTDGNFADYITDSSLGPFINAQRFQASANMTITVFKAKVDSVPGHYKCAIYSDLNGMGDRLLARSQEKTHPATGWNDFPLETPLRLTSGNYYWLAIWSDDVNARVYYTSQNGGTLKWQNIQYGDWPNPLNLERNGNGYLYCLYGEGTFDD